jgi:predicted acetyltransferase
VDYTIIKGRPEDYEDIIDFGNYVFGIDFQALLPKLYKDRRECAQHHHLVKEGHRIKAMVGSFPLGLKIGQQSLKVRGIGTVSVHKYSRGSGYMKLLMDRAVKEMQEEGCDLAVLGGQRQRYGYWGFDRSGIIMNLNFNSSNIKHIKVDVKDNYIFTKYEECRVNDLERAVKLHDSQNVHAVRENENFVDITSSWNNNLIFIYSNNEFAGYICEPANREKINEIVLINPSDIDKVVVAYMRNFNPKSLSIVLPSYRTEEFMILSRLCENYSINSCCNMYIINYINVIKAFMSLKNSISQLCDGLLVLNVEEKGRYKIQVRDGIVNVEETDMPYDISLSHLDATALLFSHSAFINTAYNITNPLVKAWFPLPLYYPEIDNV